MNRSLLLLGLFVLAAAYMRLALFIPIDWMDEGQIVYGIWRASEGEIPYRDFQHLYGPSMFFFNGLLFRIFGQDLSVLRYVLLGLKAATCVMVYVGARRMSGPVFAGVAYAVAVVMSALIWLVSTTPYASFYSIALCFAGFLCLLSLERKFLLNCAIAGLCFGFAATFKQTTGAFAFLAAALFLLTSEGEPGKRPGPIFTLVVRLSRWFTLLVPIAVACIYLAPSRSGWTFLLLLSPILFVAAILARQELQPRGSIEQHGRIFWGTVALASAFFVPLFGYAVFYISIGHGADILQDTMTGIPSISRWFTPLPNPNQNMIFWLFTFVGGFGAASLWRGDPLQSFSTPKKVALGALVVAAVVSFSALASNNWYAQNDDWWFWSTEGLLFFLPFALVWLSLFVWVRDERGQTLDAASRDVRALRLFTLFGVMTLLWLYPAGDIWHVVPLLPCCLPLLALLLDRFWNLPDENRRSALAWRVGAGAPIALLCAALLIPSPRDVARERSAKPAFLEPLPRAAGVLGESAPYTSARNGGKLIRHLTQEGYRDEAIYILSAKSLFYFLTDRVSPVQPYEFALYMVAFNVVPTERLTELIDEADLIERIDVARPLIVDDLHDAGAANVRRMLPELSRFIDTRYETEIEFGNFHVLRRVSAAPR